MSFFNLGVEILDSDETFAEYLKQNRSRLESYVVKCVPLQDIEHWLFKKLSASYVRYIYFNFRIHY